MSLKQRIRARVLGVLIAWVVRLIYYTSRKTFVDAEHLTRFFDEDQPVIIVGWHNRDALAVFAYLAKRPRGRIMNAMSSSSKDGTIAAVALNRMGLETIRGSSSRGGAKALKQLTKCLKRGSDIAMTPDGPRGPKYQVKGGVITAAKLSGAPIIPVTYQAKRKIVLNSWDSFIVPYPFNRINFVYGNPIRVPRNCPAVEIPQYAEQLRSELMRIGERAEVCS